MGVDMSDIIIPTRMHPIPTIQGHSLMPDTVISRLTMVPIAIRDIGTHHTLTILHPIRMGTFMGRGGREQVSIFHLPLSL